MLYRVSVSLYAVENVALYPVDEWLSSIRHWAKVATFYKRVFGDRSPEFLNALQYMSYYISLYRVYYLYERGFFNV